MSSKILIIKKTAKVLCLAVLALFCFIQPMAVLDAQSTFNVAEGKEVMMSSCNFGTDGKEAIDGNISGNWNDGSVTCTHHNQQAWWQVDLGDVFTIEDVNVYNRTDCCSDRLSNFDIKISLDETTWTSIYVPGTAGSPTSVDFNGQQARYVKVQLRGGNYLSLAEVEVMGNGPIGFNAALTGIASQSSNDFGTDGSEAIDGNTSGDWNDGSVTSTHENMNAWWQIDMEYLRDIYSVHMYNRTDCCWERLSNFNLMLSEDGTNWNTHFISGVCGSPTSRTLHDAGARFVKIQINDQQHLSLAEVQVMASDIRGSNVALGKPTSQAGTDFGKVSSMAVDGNTSGVFDDNTVTCTIPASQAWWRVNLEQVYEIKEIRIYNRTDCCHDRLKDFDVMISTDGVNWTTIYVPGQAGRPTTLDLNHQQAQYVKVQLRGLNFLSLAEVEVIGRPVN